MEIFIVFFRWVVLANDDIRDRRAPHERTGECYKCISLK